MSQETLMYMSAELKSGVNIHLQEELGSSTIDDPDKPKEPVKTDQVHPSNRFLLLNVI
jgi:hypothetical protein